MVKNEGHRFRIETDVDRIQYRALHGHAMAYMAGTFGNMTATVSPR
ncbi:MAG: hypothetical protein U5L98_11335 [Halomonas sp.]|nr:hypothetical protein [Halomonas sp.]MDZ7853207.1 hypothetical protein [Halomonas sp.]